MGFGPWTSLSATDPPRMRSPDHDDAPGCDLARRLDSLHFHPPPVGKDLIDHAILRLQNALAGRQHPLARGGERRPRKLGKTVFQLLNVLIGHGEPFCYEYRIIPALRQPRLPIPRLNPSTHDPRSLSRIHASNNLFIQFPTALNALLALTVLIARPMSEKFHFPLKHGSLRTKSLWQTSFRSNSGRR